MAKKQVKDNKEQFTSEEKIIPEAETERIIRPMMYRVFLQHELDTKNPMSYFDDTKYADDGHPENDPMYVFRLIHEEFMLKPNSNLLSLEQQLKRNMNFGGRIWHEPNGNVFLQNNELNGIRYLGQVNLENELLKEIYEISKKYAERLTEKLSKKSGHNYVFIDLTDWGSKRKASKLAQTFEVVDVTSKLAAFSERIISERQKPMIRSI